jgi:flagellar motor switch protein FliN/FliY
MKTDDKAASIMVNMQETKGQTGSDNLNAILDIPIQLSMEVGKAQISIRDLLKLNPGSVVELDKVVYEPLDVYVNGTLLAQGEIVTVNDKFAIRLTNIINPAERMGNLV